MGKLISDMKPIYVVGVGWHPYQKPSETSYVHLGLTAVRSALEDAGIAWEDVESSYVATARLGSACGRPMLGHLGATGSPIVHIENASASGSAAFRHACFEIACGASDVVMVMGVDKLRKVPRSQARTPTGIPGLADDAIAPFTHFALLTNEYAHKHDVSFEDIARVAVKNHANGALNQNAQRQKARSLEEVMGGETVAGALSALQCTPIGEGAAAVIICSEDGIKRLGIDQGRAVRVASSVGGSEGISTALDADLNLSIDTMSKALRDAEVKPTDLDIIEVHDAFTIEEMLYVEATGICSRGHFIPLLKEGAFNIGGQCAISPSGGLIAMGHPVGPTGVGQIGEITMQLRGEAGKRQQPNATTGLAHMVGIGAVSYVHVLSK